MLRARRTCGEMPSSGRAPVFLALTHNGEWPSAPSWRPCSNDQRIWRREHGKRERQIPPDPRNALSPGFAAPVCSHSNRFARITTLFATLDRLSNDCDVVVCDAENDLDLTAVAASSLRLARGLSARARVDWRGRSSKRRTSRGATGVPGSARNRRIVAFRHRQPLERVATTSGGLCCARRRGERDKRSDRHT